MTSLTMSFDMKEEADGWRYRFPAGDEKAEWSQAYATQKDAEAAAIKACEKHLTGLVASALGIA